MNAIILKGAALRQPPLPQSGPEPKQLPTPGFSGYSSIIQDHGMNGVNIFLNCQLS
jgi:hypothetical protein